MQSHLNYEIVKGGCIPSKYKFKTQKYNKLRWLASDLNFKLLHTGCPNGHDRFSIFFLIKLESLTIR